MYSNSFEENRQNLVAGVETVLQANDCSSLSTYDILQLLLYGDRSLPFQINKAT